MTTGLVIFSSVAAAITAGYAIMSPHADSEGFLHARIHTSAGWSMALVRVGK